MTKLNLILHWGWQLRPPAKCSLQRQTWWHRALSSVQGWTGQLPPLHGPTRRPPTQSSKLHSTMRPIGQPPSAVNSVAHSIEATLSRGQKGGFQNRFLVSRQWGGHNFWVISKVHAGSMPRSTLWPLKLGSKPYSWPYQRWCGGLPGPVPNLVQSPDPCQGWRCGILSQAAHRVRQVSIVLKFLFSVLMLIFDASWLCFLYVQCNM